VPTSIVHFAVASAVFSHHIPVMKIKKLISAAVILSLVLVVFCVSALAGDQGGGKAIPANFPKDIPVYIDAKVTDVQPPPPGMPAAAALYVVFLETPDSKATALEFYKRELAAAGWKLENAFSGSPDAFQGMKGDRMLSFGVLERGENTGIQIEYSLGK
jgi:hypothetical protein